MPSNHTHHNSPLVLGFIFIPFYERKDNQLPPGYGVFRCGSYGHFAKLDSESCTTCNGWEAVTYATYLEAVSR